jgi:hypothetical protein
MSFRNLLLRAFPRSWRDEYGEELAGVLAQRRLTVSAVVDLLGNGARQHLYRDEPWKICGGALFLWNLTVLLFARFLTRPSFLWCSMAGFLFLFGAGAWTVLRKRSGIWRATAASAKAALVGHAAPDLLEYFLMFRRGGSHWIPKTFAINLLLAFASGFTGALLGQFFTRVRKRPREA